MFINILPLQSAILVFFAFLIWVDQRPYLPTSFTCEMSYMYGRPQYYQIPLDHSIRSKFSFYSLYLYTEEGRDTLEHLGTPVLFIPGSSGSHEQVRSIATHTMHLAERFDSKLRFTFFAVSLNKELSAIHGGYLWSQMQFVVECIQFLKNFYKNTQYKQIILVGHSMGGVVARGVFMDSELSRKEIPLIITLATPHIAPPVLFDKMMEVFYFEMQASWSAVDFAKPILLSIGGGYSDIQVSSALIQLEYPYEMSFSMVSTEVPRVWTVADHQCIVWCKELQVLLARGLVNSVNSTNGSLKKPGMVMKIFEEEIRYGFKSPKLVKRGLTCDDEINSYRKSFRIESGMTCIDSEVFGTGYDVILISRNLNVTVISCPLKNMENCSVHPTNEVEILPIGNANSKIFYLTPNPHNQYALNTNIMTQITMIRTLKDSDKHRIHLPTPFPLGTHSRSETIKANSEYEKVELLVTWPMHIAYRIEVSVQDCQASDLTIVETSDGISDKYVHTTQPFDFYIRPQRIAFSPAVISLELWHREDRCKYSLQISASWWVTFLNFCVLHLPLVPHWALLAIAVQASLDILSEEQLIMLAVCLCVMFFQFGMESFVVLLFNFAIYSILGITAKVIQLCNLWSINLALKSKWRIPHAIFAIFFMILAVASYFSSSLGLILLFILTHLSYLGRRMKHPIIASWSLVLLLWLIGMSIPSLIAWWNQLQLIGWRRLHSDTFSFHLIIASFGVLMHFINGDDGILPDVEIPYMVVSLGPIVLYSYAMYVIAAPSMMYLMVVSVVFCITQAS